MDVFKSSPGGYNPQLSVRGFTHIYLGTFLGAKSVHMSISCVLALQVQIFNRVCLDGMQYREPSYGLALGLYWFQFCCLELLVPQCSEACCSLLLECSVAWLCLLCSRFLGAHFYRVCWDGIQGAGPIYGMALGIWWVQLCWRDQCNETCFTPQLVCIEGCTIRLSYHRVFISGDMIGQVPFRTNYWNYLVGSGILATCCGWSALFSRHYFTCPIS